MQDLLDDRYADVKRTPADEDLRRVGKRLLDDMRGSSRSSDGWAHLKDALGRLGADLL
jgi:hypothetical protein